MQNLAEMNCKFCKQRVLFNCVTRRVLEQDGKTPHSDNCPRRKAHYSQRAYDTSQAIREQRKH